MDLTDYKLKLQEKLIASFFSEKTHISGNEILSFCAEKQINMFVLYVLLKEWKSSLESMRSPYFDFDNQEVKSALSSYMNVVSKNILIEKSDFEALLSKALNFTFQLVENPESFIVSNHLENDLQEISKYVQYHKPYFEGDKDYEVDNKLDEVKSKFSTLFASENVKGSTPELLIDKSPSDNLSEKSIADMYDEDESPVYVQKIDEIKSAISINQKFIFVNELFDGNNVQYNETINRLDSCSDVEEANQIVSEIVISDSNKEALEQLSLLIKHKYNF